MKKLHICLFAVITLGLSTPTQNAQALENLGFSNTAPDSFADMVEDLLPAVVNISSTQKMVEPSDYPEMPQFPPGSPFEDFFEEFMDRRGMGTPAIPPASLGSGFVIDAEKGIVVTNNHVVKDADEVRVIFHDDESVEAEVIGRDDKTDLAILKVETDKKLTAVKFGDSDVLRVGDWVVAIGNPFGLGGTVTAGIVSARSRDIRSGPYDDYIQTDASINRGNSGGPMFNLKGEVIGINTAIFSPTGGSVGIGFAIPSALAEPVVNQIVEFGRTRRGWIGVRIQTVTDEIAESLGLKNSRGALVASITADGPAEEAGLKPGDIILEFNGKKIDEMREVPRIVAETKIDTKVPLVIWRDNKEMKTEISVAELEKAEEEGLLGSVAGNSSEERGVEIDRLDITVGNITTPIRQEFKIPDAVNGIVISKVDPNSEAARKGLDQGDVIVDIDQQPVTDPENANDIIRRAAKNGRSSVLLLINREGDVSFVALKLNQEQQ